MLDRHGHEEHDVATAARDLLPGISHGAASDFRHVRKLPAAPEGGDVGAWVESLGVADVVSGRLDPWLVLLDRGPGIWLE
jgi:hypothetical protein